MPPWYRAMPHKILDQAIEDIAAQALVGAITRREAQRRLLVAIQAHFQCSRVSIWRFHGRPGSSVMRCTGGYTDAGLHLPAGAALHQHEYSEYFDEIFSSGAYVCNDTTGDARLDGMRESYLKPLGVMALLDAVFAFNGQAQGLVCCEQVGAPRAWTSTDRADLKRCASAITRHANRWLRAQKMARDSLGGENN